MPASGAAVNAIKAIFAVLLEYLGTTEPAK